MHLKNNYQRQKTTNVKIATKVNNLRTNFFFVIIFDYNSDNNSASICWIPMKYRLMHILQTVWMERLFNWQWHLNFYFVQRIFWSISKSIFFDDFWFIWFVYLFYWARYINVHVDINGKLSNWIQRISIWIYF